MIKEIRIDTSRNIQVIRPQWNTDPPSNLESLKETIRRLRIQNKKLLEQVAHLKEELKNRTAEKNKTLQQLKEFGKINNVLQALQKMKSKNK